MNIIHFGKTSGGGGSYENAPIINIPYFDSIISKEFNTETPWENIAEGLTFETFKSQVFSQVSNEHSAPIYSDGEVIGYNYFGWINDETDGIKSMCAICDSVNGEGGFLTIAMILGSAVLLWSCCEDGITLFACGGV